MELKIAWLYPDLMNIYGDRGNIIAITYRAKSRGIDIKLKNITVENSEQDLEDSDLVFMGGAQDKQQKIVALDLHEKKAKILLKLLNNKIPGLFICGAYQFLGKYYQLQNGEKIPGLGYFDLYTIHNGETSTRCIGNIVTKINRDLSTINFQFSTLLVGFENHGGRTYLGKSLQPLSYVLKGYGNNGEDKTEGAILYNAIGTYLHGPILPKNPQLADWLIKTALEVKYQKQILLTPLADELEWQAHQEVLKLK